MRKIAKLVAVVLVICSIMSVFSACGDKNKQIIDEKIKADYIAEHPRDHLTNEDITLRHYGEFNETYVFMMDINGYDALTGIFHDIISDVVFIYPSGNKLTVYSDGKFYSLKEAFEKELLTHDNLLEVQTNYRSDHENIYHDYIIS